MYPNGQPGASHPSDSRAGPSTDLCTAAGCSPTSQGLDRELLETICTKIILIFFIVPANKMKIFILAHQRNALTQSSESVQSRKFFVSVNFFIVLPVHFVK